MFYKLTLCKAQLNKDINENQPLETNIEMSLMSLQHWWKILKAFQNCHFNQSNIFNNRSSVTMAITCVIQNLVFDPYMYIGTALNMGGIDSTYTG